MPAKPAFTNSQIRNAIDALANSSEEDKRAVGHNFRWDERLGADRIAAFENHPTVPARLTGGDLVHDLTEAYKAYSNDRLEWSGNPRDPVADTFLDCNSHAGFATLPDENRELVRIVKIDPVLRSSGLDFEEFRRAFDLVVNSDDDTEKVLDAKATVELFLEAWNAYDRRMPAFCGFLTDVADAAEDSDWPHKIRDQFGVGHLHVPPGAAAMPVMLLRYTVGEVLRAAEKVCGRKRAVRVPTVLESNMFSYFYPSPTELPFGRTVYLGGGIDEDTLTCELVHLPVDLGLAHIWKVGRVTRPIPDVSLTDVRDDHLELIRLETGRADFGEFMNHARS